MVTTSGDGVAAPATGGSALSWGVFGLGVGSGAAGCGAGVAQLAQSRAKPSAVCDLFIGRDHTTLGLLVTLSRGNHGAGRASPWPSHGAMIRWPRGNGSSWVAPFVGLRWVYRCGWCQPSPRVRPLLLGARLPFGVGRRRG